jgi:phage-related protein
MMVERLNMLRTNAPVLPFPHSSQVEGQLRELRCHYGKTLYRVLYRRRGDCFVLLHVFEKTTGKIPDAEIQVARLRWADLEIRVDAAARAEGPVGQPAP